MSARRINAPIDIAKYRAERQRREKKCRDIGLRQERRRLRHRLAMTLFVAALHLMMVPAWPGSVSLRFRVLAFLGSAVLLRASAWIGDPAVGPSGHTLIAIDGHTAADEEHRT